MLALPLIIAPKGSCRKSSTHGMMGHEALWDRNATSSGMCFRTQSWEEHGETTECKAILGNPCSGNLTFHTAAMLRYWFRWEGALEVQRHRIEA